MHHFDHQINVSGLFCPYPLLEAKKSLTKLSKGDVLKVIATDPASVIDFKAFASTSAHRLLDYQEVEKGKYCFWIEKGVYTSRKRIFKFLVKRTNIMQLENISHDELQRVMTQLDQAIHNHQQWYNSLIRTLVCRLPGDQNDMSTDAHKRCRFGQWYYNHAHEELHNYSGFVAIGTVHQYMHELTKNLLATSNAGNRIYPLEFDNFANALERLRLEIFTLKNELEMLLYTRDPLTMAITRISMLPTLREQKSIASRQGQPCCIGMLDLDFFKKVNDDYGHPTGDKVLAALAGNIRKHLRPYDKLFRYGGEEFLLCFPQTDLKTGRQMVERLREAIAKMNIPSDSEQPINITISAGLALLDPNEPVEEAIDHADKAMYSAKSTGRNSTRTWGIDL